MGAVFAQALGLLVRAHPDHEAEAAPATGLDAGGGVLEDGPLGGPTPRRRAASRNMAGSGLPGSPRRATSTPSTRTWKRSVSRATRRMATVFRLEDTTAVFMPSERASRTSAMADW